MIHTKVDGDFCEFTPQTPIEPGMYVLEASAGTGKTYQITSLFLRLIGEKGIEVENILAMTFTVAATAEMKDRIRKRLQKAVSLLQAKLAGKSIPSEEDDELLRVMLEKGNGLDKQRLYDNFYKALTDMDKAQVFTIHGFCYRMLQSFAFEVGLEFDVELIENTSDIVREALAEIYVRKMENLTSGLQWLIEPATRDNLFDKVLDSLLGLSDDPDVRLLPEKTELPEAPDIEQWNRLFLEAQQIWHKSRDEIAVAIQRAMSKKPSSEDDSNKDEVFQIQKRLDTYFSRMRNPCNAVWREVLRKSCSKRLRSALSKQKTTIAYNFIELLNQLHDLIPDFEQWYAQWRLHFLHEAYDSLMKETRKKKREKKVMTFHDLLVLLRDAIKDEDRGELVKNAIRRKYRAVLVDEFQDTDIVQWQIFRELFRTPEHYLFLVGDPKQSIYAFRKADVFAYLEAQKEAQKRYTINVNWRSDEALVKAINHLYTRHRDPFKLRQIKYHEVQCAERNKGSRVKDVPEFMRYPLTFRIKKKAQAGQQNDDGDVEHLVLRTVASDIVELLNSNAEVLEDGHWRGVQPRDIAVLVRTNDEAREVKRVLGERKVPAVIFGQESVFASDAAKYLSYILRAVLNPGEVSFLKTALATPFFGKTPEDVQKLNENDISDYIRFFIELKETWSRQGIAPMLSRVTSYSNAIAHIVACVDGERLVTDFRHLTELLQQRESEFELGIDGLFAWFSRKISEADKRTVAPEEEQARLESDADAVNVVTMHKAKGLEYGFVFCPFLWEGVNLHTKAKLLRFHRTDADGRYILNFALRDFLGKDEKKDLEQEALREEFQERLRIAYVALTRAKFRCIVYGFAQPTKNGSRRSTLWWILTEKELPEDKVVTEDDMREAIEMLVQSSNGTIGFTEIQKEIKETRYSPKKQEMPEQLDCRRFSQRSFLPFSRTSFTGLAGFGKKTDEPTEVEPKTVVEHYEAIPATLLPGFPDGAIPGQCIHEIFSKISFKDFPNRGQIEMINETLNRWRYASFASEVQQMVDVVLRYPLEPSTGLTLEAIEDNDRFCEIGFVVPAFPSGTQNYAHITPKRIADILRAEGSDVEKQYANYMERLGFSAFEGFVAGKMDLVFRYDGRWYLVDYKTNKLGLNFEDYRYENLLQVMMQEHYVFQYLLYYIALHRYLQYRLADYDPRKHLGSVFYLFVRGMKEGGGDTGVFVAKPPLGLVDSLSNLFTAPLGGR